MVKTIPASLIDANNDLQFVRLTAKNGLRTRDVEEYSLGAFETTQTLLPELSDVTFSGLAAHWTTLPSGIHGASLDLQSENGFARLQATAAWLAAQTSLTLDVTGVPGYMDSWAIDPTTTTHGFSVRRDVSMTTTLYSSVGDVAPVVGHAKRAKLRAERARRLAR